VALSITDLRKGTVFQFENVPYKVVEYNQKVMGRGGSIVNVRIKSLIDGKVLDKTFKGNEQIDSADVSKRDVQYLYNDAQGYHFMDSSSYEQLDLSNDELSNQKDFLKEGDGVQLQLFGGRPIGLELPKNVPLKVTYTEDVVRGDTATNLLKDATTETGLTIKVPAFIKQGDIVRVDTRTSEYLEREK
jgi:elongation factor P